MSDGTARDKVILHAARRGNPARGVCQRAVQKATVRAAKRGLFHLGLTREGSVSASVPARALRASPMRACDKLRDMCKRLWLLRFERLNR